MQGWKLVERADGLRMEEESLRKFGDPEFTLAHLLYGRLGRVTVAIFYFPSRFDTNVDKSMIDNLHHFGDNTSTTTSVNIWDPKDPEFDRVLQLFGLKTVPAVVLATGLQVTKPRGPVQTPLYTITFSEPAVLCELARFQSAMVNVLWGFPNLARSCRARRRWRAFSKRPRRWRAWSS